MSDQKKVTVTKVTESQKKKRLEIQNTILNLMDDIELTNDQKKKNIKSYNREQWEKKFASMSDLDFHNFMKKIAENRDYGFSFEANTVTSKNKLTIKKIEEVANKYDVKLSEYVIFPHKNRENKSNPVVSRTPLPIIVVTVKRLQQMLSKKNKISSDNSSVNPVSGQVTGDSKGGRLSNTQTYSLAATNQLNSIKEFLSVRSDDEVAKREMLKEIESTGKAHLSNYNIKTSNKQSIQALEAFLRASGLYSNILRSDKLPKSSENLTNEFKYIKDLDINSYKLVIFGYKDSSKELEQICNKIKEIQPDYILSDLLVSGEVLKRKDVTDKLLNKQIEIKTFDGNVNNITELYETVSILNNNLISISAFEHDIEKFNNKSNLIKFIENKYLTHIKQYNALENVKIAVIINDNHLRYLPWDNEYDSFSPITEYFKNKDGALLVRSNIDESKIRMDSYNQLKERIYLKFITDRQISDTKEDNTKIIKEYHILFDVHGIDTSDTADKPLYLGKLSLISNIFYKKNDGLLSVLIIDPEHEPEPSHFITIEFDKEYKDMELEYIITQILETNQEFPKYLYSLVTKKSILAEKYKEVPEFENYIKLPSENLKCIRIKGE